MEREKLLETVRKILKVKAPFFDSWTDLELNKLYVILRVKGVNIK